LVMTPLLTAPPGKTALTDEERLKAFDALRALLKRAPKSIAPQATRFLEALDAIPATPQSLQRLETVLLGGFPKFRDQLVTALSPKKITLDSLPAAIRERRVAADGQVLVEIHPKEDLRNPAARDRFVEAVRQVVPDVSGSAVRFAAVGDAVVGSFQMAAAIASGLIVLLLFLVLRHVRDVLMVLTPLALAILFTVAMTVVLNTPFNLANIIVLPLVLGLGVAFGIQIVLRYRAETDGNLMRTSTPQAVVFSALTTIGSFGALALSDHPGTASMGYLLTLSITLTMICTLIVLPALLAIVARKHRHR
ncbi:MAG: MMPL family transporter, partial [Alphaproteobacteria bacterium]|nr:MMPL family transporter [Alphaproteobacteria bacterium]